MTELSIFFNPKSIAIIGASDSVRFGHITTNYLLNNPKFNAYPVHIKKDEILGHKAYKNIKDIPFDIELAIILVANDFVLQTVKDCAEKGVRAIIIESAGFAETGMPKYVQLQEEIVKIARQSGIRIIGPNCMGVTNFNNGFSSADLDVENTVLPNGTIATIAQSGVVGNIFIDWASSESIGFSKAITLGNKIDVDEVDMLEFLNKDPDTSVICIYLEGTTRGKELIKVLKEMTKPVLIVKSGKSKIGSNAVKSHTGSLAGNDQIYNAAFHQCPAVFRMRDFQEMFNIAHIMSNQPLANGKRIAVITGSGSLGILTCDAIEEYGLELAQLTDKTIDEIKSVIPGWVSLKGTVDLGPSLFESFLTSVKAIFADENVDSVLYIFSVPRWPLERFNISLTPHFRLMKKLASQYQKPCVCVCFGSRWVLDYVQTAANKGKGVLPVITQLDHAVNAFKIMYEYKKSQIK